MFIITSNCDRGDYMRYLMTISYDGSKFFGYQKQSNVSTIQEELERVLTIINNKKVLVSGSGRTDALVHALNQKVHCDLDINITPEKLKKAINSLVDKSIYIKDVEVVDDNFHARFNVKKKEYVYKINVGEYNPIEKDYIFQYNKKLDIINMKKALKLLEGTHDFKSLTKANNIKDDYVRTIYKTSLQKDGDIITITFVGNGFLRYMVRNMVGLLLEIGEGKRDYHCVNDILNAKNRCKAGITAHPEGLYLSNVYYK